jgi:hypothetical protein
MELEGFRREETTVATLLWQIVSIPSNLLVPSQLNPFVH